MHLGQALNMIAKEYPNGCIEFYDALPNNPWQGAHDKLEGALLLHRDTPQYFEKMSRECDAFVKELRKLIALYKAANPEQPMLLNFRSSFAIGNEDHVKQMQSLAACACRVCGTTDNIRAASHPKHGSALYCPECLRASA